MIKRKVVDNIENYLNMKFQTKILTHSRENDIFLEFTTSINLILNKNMMTFINLNNNDDNSNNNNKS